MVFRNPAKDKRTVHSFDTLVKWGFFFNKSAPVKENIQQNLIYY